MNNEELILELADKYSFGVMVPEGDGWSWEFAPDQTFIDACRELLKRADRTA